MNLKIINVGVLLGIFLFLSNCTPTYKAPKDFKIPTLMTNKIPLRVGLYMPSDVCHYEIIKTKGEGVGWIFQLGDALCNGIERMLRMSFDDVVILESIDSDISQHRIKAIIAPQIVSGSARLSAAFGFEGTAFLIRVKYTATDVNKRLLWVDTFQGECNERSEKFKNYMKSKYILTGFYKNCMGLTLEDHFHNALEGMLLSKWWEKIE